MSKKVLFSPIGNTDPIKYCWDGSMLHICRHYLPDVVYLYLSHEMMEYHRKDNRYVDSIERLGELLGHHFEIRLIERDDLVEVQEYDILYQDFKNVIQSIEEEMEEGDELLLNMASGTPAMKSALLILATYAEYRYVPIQVVTPRRKSNIEYEDREGYEWELNEDNEPGAPNRCHEPKYLNLMKTIKLDTVKKHVQAYDYHAALTLAGEIKQDIPKEAYRMIQIAEARLKLNCGAISSLSAGSDINVYPIREAGKQNIFEYALTLQIKLKKEEYADFVRGITPLVADLLGEIMEKECGISMESCCYRKRDDERWYWDKKKVRSLGLMDYLVEAYGNPDPLGNEVIYASQIAKIIHFKSTDRALLEKIDEILEIEKMLRNVAAHEIVSVTNQWIRKKTRRSVESIFSLIKYLTRRAGINAKEEDWNSYDKMNGDILLLLQ